MLIEASTTARTAPKDFAACSSDSMGSAEACETGSAGGLGVPVPADEPGPGAGVPDPGVPGPVAASASAPTARSPLPLADPLRLLIRSLIRSSRLDRIRHRW